MAEIGGHFIDSRPEIAMLIRAASAIAVSVAMIASASAALAAETINYTYDARGRLIKVVSSGSVNNNDQICYKLDKAGNRIRVDAAVGSTFTCP